MTQADRMPGSGWNGRGTSNVSAENATASEVLPKGAPGNRTMKEISALTRGQAQEDSTIKDDAAESVPDQDKDD